MIARRFRLVAVLSLLASVVVLALASVPALAAAPEEPETKPPTEVTNTGAALHGVVNPHALFSDSWYFEDDIGATCSGTGASTTSVIGPYEVEAQSAEAQLSGLQPNTKYTFCLVVRNEAEEATVGPAVSFTTTNVGPIVTEQSFTNVGSSGATLRAQINPEGISTTYYFDYGTSAAYGSRTQVASLGSGSTGANVLAALVGLQPETIYHFRVVAANEAGEVTRGAEMIFTTLPVGLLGLPDDRGYELVSVGADGNVYEPTLPGLEFENERTRSLPLQASVDGNAVTYVAYPSATGGNGSIGKEKGNQYLATRTPADGWTAVDIQPAGVREAYYQAFSSDLSLGILDARAPTALTPGAPGNYDLLYSHSGLTEHYEPLFTAEPQSREWYEFRAANVADLKSPYSLAFAGANAGTNTVPASSDLLFEANAALTANALDPGENANDLYDSVSGQPFLVNVLPNGSPNADATFGANAYVPGENPPDFSHVISNDGSRIFWTDLSTGDLYVRERGNEPQSPLDGEGRCAIPADACTVEVDASHGPDSSGGGRFWTATSDGAKVFFTDDHRLTADSTAGPEAPDLYEYQVETGELSDLTVDQNLGEEANVQGVLGASEDGSYVYFAAGGRLAPGASSQTCAQFHNPGEASGCNLYVLHDGEPQKFVATLSGNDSGGPKGGGNGGSGYFGDWEPGLGRRTAEVTKDGRHLVYLSRGEVYVYGAESGQLSCASCDPSGQTDEGKNLLQPSFVANYMLRSISENGSQVFFDSTNALVSQDTNGQADVYEWERDGAGSCVRPVGCIYLLSGGTSTDNSFFLDASANGDSVFIVTRARLTAQDENETFDLYDARVGVTQPLSPPACTGSGCQGVPGAPPIFATPSSTTFGGVGNFAPPASRPVVKSKSKVRPCGRRHVRKHGKCVQAKLGKPGKRTKSAKGRK